VLTCDHRPRWSAHEPGPNGHAAVVSNAALTRGGAPNPAAVGGFPRLIGYFHRERRLLSLEGAVRRATSLPADRLRLRDVGRITEGHRADLVILDPATVGDGGWPEHPADPPTGIRTVLVAGKVTAERGEIVGASGHGHLLR